MYTNFEIILSSSPYEETDIKDLPLKIYSPNTVIFSGTGGRTSRYEFSTQNPPNIRNK